MNDTPSGQLILWGSRGSSPTPGGRFIRHGGHTSCLSLSHDGAQFVFDAGSGIRELGRSLMEDSPRQIHLFITHTHWDHIQVFRFSRPLTRPGGKLKSTVPDIFASRSSLFSKASSTAITSPCNSRICGPISNFII